MKGGFHSDILGHYFYLLSKISLFKVDRKEAAETCLAIAKGCLALLEGSRKQTGGSEMAKRNSSLSSAMPRAGRPGRLAKAKAPEQTLGAPIAATTLSTSHVIDIVG